MTTNSEEKRIINSLLLIASVGLAIAGVIFLVILFFNNNDAEWVMPAILFCVVLGNLFNIVRSLIK